MYIFIILFGLTILVGLLCYSCVSANQLDIHQLRVESVETNIITGEVSGYFYDMDAQSYVTLKYNTELFGISLHDFMLLPKDVVILLSYEENTYKSYNY